MAKFTWQQLTEKFEEYAQGVAYVNRQVEQKKIRPVLNSGLNGKYPPLYKVYQSITAPKKADHWQEEITRTIMPPLSASYYLKHPAQYEKDRPQVQALNTWIQLHGQPDGAYPVSINERSFEIFGQEKYLKSTRQAILPRLGLPQDYLACYETCEPLINWYSINTQPGQNILIVENLDPFITLRRLLMAGHTAICSTEIQTVLYGAGKRIIASFADLLYFAQPFLRHESNRFYYLGDLDYEGMQIYESFVSRYPQAQIQLFVPGYIRMTELAMARSNLPDMPASQNPRAAEFFLNQLADHLSQPQLDFLTDRLRQGKYIPQEILSASIIVKEGKGHEQ